MLGCLLVKQRIKQHLGKLFVGSVYGSKSEKDDKESAKRKEGEMKRTIDAARELGGQVEDLGRVLEKVGKTPGAALDHITLNLDKDVDFSQSQDSVDTHIDALLSALVLYPLLDFHNKVTTSETLISDYKVRSQVRNNVKSSLIMVYYLY